MVTPRTGEQLILLGDKNEAARLVPIARNIARDLAKRVSDIGSLKRKTTLPDAWIMVQVRHNRWKITIYAESNPVTYEFFTSHEINYLFKDTYQLGGFKIVCGRQSMVTIKPKVVTPAPVLDFCDDCTLTPVPPPDPPPPYPNRSCASSYTFAAVQEMTSWPFWWQTRAVRYVFYPGNKGDTFLTSSDSMVPGWSEIGVRSRLNYANATAGKFGRFPWQQPVLFWTADKDYPATIPNPQPDRNSDPNPYKARAALTKANDGTSWVVQTYENGWFQAFPLKAEIAEDDVLQVFPNYPDWADFGFQAWTFNSTGTRAACCPYEGFNPGLTANGDTVFKSLGGSLTCLGMRFLGSSGIPKEVGREDSPGVVEVAISITKQQVGYAMSVDVVKAEAFRDTGIYPVYADYLADDERLPLPADSLIVLGYDVYIGAGSPYVEGSDEYYPDDLRFMTRTRFRIMHLDDEDTFTDLHTITGLWDVRAEFATQYQGCDFDADGLSDYFGFADSLGTSDFSAFDFSQVLSAIDLKTLSWMTYIQQQFAAGDGWYTGIQVYSFGELHESNLDEGLTFPTWDVDGFVAASVDWREVWSNLYHTCFEPNPFGAFVTHPKGHWSLASMNLPYGDDGAIPDSNGTPFYPPRKSVDIIELADGRTFTHQELHNEAFGDDRTPAYYVTSPIDSEDQGGTFRTFGLFRDKGKRKT